MSQALASARKRRGVPQQNPEPIQNKNTLPNTASNVNSSGLTLPQVISLVDKRLVTLETFMKETKETNMFNSLHTKNETITTSNKEEVSNENINWIDEFNHRFELLADEINNMKDIVLKLQSYTMEVNKTLMDERINVFSDLGSIANLNTNSNELLSTNDLTSMDLRSMVQHELNELSNDN
jgi:hypothetical protein